jgi:hypothetical protein
MQLSRKIRPLTGVLGPYPPCLYVGSSGSPNTGSPRRFYFATAMYAFKHKLRVISDIEEDRDLCSMEPESDEVSERLQAKRPEETETREQLRKAVEYSVKFWKRFAEEGAQPKSLPSADQMVPRFRLHQRLKSDQN